jgi:hypothetical protein
LPWEGHPGWHNGGGVGFYLSLGGLSRCDVLEKQIVGFSQLMVFVVLNYIIVFVYAVFDVLALQLLDGSKTIEPTVLCNSIMLPDHLKMNCISLTNDIKFGILT